MKSVCVFFLICISFNAFAQLRLNSNGNVKIGNGSGYYLSGIVPRFEVNTDGPAEAALYSANATSPNIARLWTINSVFAYGFGIDSYGKGGIYRNLWNPTQMITFNSDGCVGINYSSSMSSYKLYVGGSAYCTGLWVSSDKRLKTDISKIENPLNKLLKIDGVAYKFSSNYFKSNEISKTVPIEVSNVQFGFIAQDIKEIFPELVSQLEDSISTNVINYNGFIPVLVEAIKLQQDEIIKLKNEIRQIYGEKNINLQSGDENSDINTIKQNFPNPVSEITRIDFNISANSYNAKIDIYSYNGKLIKSFNNLPKGLSHITLSKTDFSSGMYFYSLIIDNEVIDTKSFMVVD